MAFASPVEGALYTVSGMLELLSVLFQKNAHRGWLILLGIADVLIGLWVLLMLQVTALLALVFAVSISLIIRGAFLSVIGIRMKAFATS